MGGEGSISAMRISLKNNAGLLNGRKKRGYFKRELSYAEIRKYYKESTEPLTDGIDREYDLKAIRTKLIVERRKNRNIQIIVIIIVTTLVGFGMFLLLGRNTSDNNRKPVQQKKDISILLSDSFDDYMHMGKSDISKQSYFFAIGNYQRALKIRPNNLQAEFGLAKAYSKSCRYQKTFCQEANELIQKMEETYPNQNSFTKLRMKYLD